MGVVADARKGKFNHVGAPDQASASGAQAGHGRAVAFGGGRLGQHHRAGGGHLALHIEQVFDRHAQAGQRALRVGRVRGRFLQQFGGELGKHLLASRAAGHGQAALGLFKGLGLALAQGLAGGVQVRLGHGGWGRGQGQMLGAIILRLCTAMPLAFQRRPAKYSQTCPHKVSRV